MTNWLLISNFQDKETEIPSVFSYDNFDRTTIVKCILINIDAPKFLLFSWYTHSSKDLQSIWKPIRL
jgi:hypothetical protein